MIQLTTALSGASSKVQRLHASVLLFYRQGHKLDNSHLRGLHATLHSTAWHACTLIYEAWLCSCTLQWHPSDAENRHAMLCGSNVAYERDTCTCLPCRQ